MALNPFRWSKTIRSPEEIFAFCVAAAEFLGTVSRIKILDGQFITARFVGASNVDAQHSLGRPYRGVFVVASTNATGTPAITALDAPSLAKLGGDPSKIVALGSTSAFTANVTLWVF